MKAQRRSWIFGLGLVLAVAAGVASAVQAGARAAGGEADEPRTLEEYLNPALTPEESAAVERGIDAHVERTRRRARAEAGLDEEVEPRRNVPGRARAVNDYRQCMAEASRAPAAEDREVQSRACRNLPGAPR